MKNWANKELNLTLPRDQVAISRASARQFTYTLLTNITLKLGGKSSISYSALALKKARRKYLEILKPLSNSSI